MLKLFVATNHTVQLLTSVLDTLIWVSKSGQMSRYSRETFKCTLKAYTSIVLHISSLDPDHN